METKIGVDRLRSEEDGGGGCAEARSGHMVVRFCMNTWFLLFFSSSSLSVFFVLHQVVIVFCEKTSSLKENRYRYVLGKNTDQIWSRSVFFSFFPSSFCFFAILFSCWIWKIMDL